jgi:hypothetical protein
VKARPKRCGGVKLDPAKVNRRFSPWLTRWGPERASRIWNRPIRPISDNDTILDRASASGGHAIEPARAGRFNSRCGRTCHGCPCVACSQAGAATTPSAARSPASQPGCRSSRTVRHWPIERTSIVESLGSQPRAAGSPCFCIGAVGGGASESARLALGTLGPRPGHKALLTNGDNI